MKRKGEGRDSKTPKRRFRIKEEKITDMLEIDSGLLRSLELEIRGRRRNSERLEKMKKMDIMDYMRVLYDAIFKFVLNLD